ncbi:MAG: hypothetical protein ONB44_11550 [candidate division KSB1 bacterium]|nr:hypothetical protein [candidate division KSB1 bacterium]MDZ7302759.1 hypothetical protein [candidate division KSB1 bacterium]MDZ7310073.1 hypothetical protein [candidate division KSB1 bacterium]
MKVFSRRALVLCFLLLFALIFVVDGATGFAAEPKSKKARDVNLAKPNTVDHIVSFDGNRIFNYIVNNGDIVTDNVGGGAGFFWPSVPRTSRSQTVTDLRGTNTADYSSGVWICGTVDGQPRTAIVEYSSEFIAGKILPDGKRDDATLEKYRVYKIIKGDGPGVKDYDEWPKADGAPTTADGKPLLIGDQTLWFVMNDLEVSRHNAPISGSPPIGLEVQTTVFGFNAANPLGDIMFVKWVIINKGTGNLDSAYIAVWDDPDLGDASDDLVGCDTTLGLGFVYNGDPNDGQYGTNTPALGFDFFQGPEAPPGSGRRLKMTSFAKYTNGAPAGQGDPDNVAEVYNYMTGFWQNGQPFIDPITGNVTKFIHAGDPVTRKGWLDSAPGDRRFLMSSGPFVLAKGDTQTIVGAKVIAPGANPSSSIAALRFYDSFAQSAFDNNFDIVQAPAPKVSVTRLDQEIVLNWSEGSADVEAFDQRGYKFQGYKVYQGESLTGPYRQIAIYDIPDGLQNIYDTQFDTETGLLVDKPVVIAGDAGVQRFISIKTDAIFNPNQRLSNYRDYYFAVTSYVVNMEAVPKVIESSLAAFRVSPTAPDYGVAVTEKTGTKRDMAHPKGTGDGTFFYQIVDPGKVVTANYRITWNDDSTPEEGQYTFNVLRNGTPVLTKVAQTGRTSEGDPSPSAPVIDGVQIQILPGTFSAPNTILEAKQTKDVDPNDNGLHLWGGGAPFGLPDDLSSTFFGGGSSDVNQLKADLEFRFTGVKAGPTKNDTLIVSGGQLGIIRSRSDDNARAVIRMPFELWDVENNQQINVFVTDRNVGGSPWGDRGVPLYYRMKARNYITPIHTPYLGEALTTTSYSRTNSNATWILFFESGEHEPVSQWSTGDVYLVRFANPTVTSGADADEYTFSTTQVIVKGQADAKAQLLKVNIVPNPYWAQNPGERDPINRFIRITNMPGSGATIRIFTLAGELVRVIDDAARAANGTSGMQYANWDLRNEAGIPVASGIYIMHIEVQGVGSVVRKAVIVMPEERLDVY